MAFTVEDGTGLAAANSYLSVAAADTYHTDRGHSAGWTGADIVKEDALVIASEYIDARFARRFRGQKRFSVGRLKWPRSFASDDSGFAIANDEIPGKLEDAVAEYALRALTLGQLFIPDPALGYATRDSIGSGTTQDPPVGQKVKRVKEVIGPIEDETEYQESPGSNLIVPAYLYADMLIQDLLIPSDTALRA